MRQLIPSTFVLTGAEDAQVAPREAVVVGQRGGTTEDVQDVKVRPQLAV